jgi:hypothetical protein
MEAAVRRSRRMSMIWAIPIIAIAIGDASRHGYGTKRHYTRLCPTALRYVCA